MNKRVKTVTEKNICRDSSIRNVALNKARGFTLLEVLVAILILCIGVVAALGLQVGSLKSSIDAKHQSVALELSSDLASMMRSNSRIATLNGVGDNPYLIDRHNAAPDGIASNLDSDSVSSKDRAIRDIEQWYKRLYDALPDPHVVVCFDSDPYKTDGTPRWACNGGNNLYIKIGWSLRRGTVGGTELDLGVPGVVVPVGVCNDDKNTSARISCYGNG